MVLVERGAHLLMGRRSIPRPADRKIGPNDRRAHPPEAHDGTDGPGSIGSAAADLMRRRRAYRRGTLAESVVAWWYRLRGYRVVQHRYRTALGEVDLVVRRGRRLVFVEVKARDDADAADEAVGGQSAWRIKAAAEIYLAANPDLLGCDMSFDLVCVLRGFRIISVPDAL